MKYSQMDHQIGGGSSRDENRPMQAPIPIPSNNGRRNEMLSQMDHRTGGGASRDENGPMQAPIPISNNNARRIEMLSQIDHRAGLVDENGPITNANQNPNLYRTLPQGPSLPGQGPASPGSAESGLGGMQESAPIMMAIPGVPSSQEYMGGNGNPDQLNAANQMIHQMNNLRSLAEMLERSSSVVTSAAELAGSSTSLLKNVITSMIQGAQQLNLQIDTMQRLSTDLSKEISKPLGGIQPLIENQLKVVTDMTKNVENMLVDINQIRSSFMGLIYYVPYVLGVIAGTFLMTLVLIVLVCCSLRRRKSKSVSGVKGEWSMQPTRHHAGSNPRYEKNIEISYPFAVKKLAKMNK